MKMLNT